MMKYVIVALAGAVWSALAVSAGSFALYNDLKDTDTSPENVYWDTSAHLGVPVCVAEGADAASFDSHGVSTFGSAAIEFSSKPQTGLGLIVR